MRALLYLIAFVTLPALAAPPSSFSTAKRIAEAEIYFDQDQTFYCGCDLDFEAGSDLASCGYEIRKQPKRAARVEWEHIMPAYDFGRQRQCWQDGGRRNCRANDPVFRRAEADLVNLVPSVGEVNGDRSNMRYGMAVSADAYQYGQCRAKVDFPERTFEPPTEVRGDVARTYWYMRDTYGIQISRQQQQLFQAWANADPVSDWERERNRRIAAIQGSANPYVDETAPTVQQVAESPRPAPLQRENDEGFSCATRQTCGQMRSCAEARFHLERCGNGRLDGDNDGTPCESICR